MCLFTSEDIHAYVIAKVPNTRALHYYYLALSLENMFSSRSSPLSSVLKSLNQLIEEFEYFISGSAMQYTRLMMAHTIPCPYPQIIQNDIEEDQVMKASILKYQNTVAYEFLKTPTINFQLDYVEVVIAFCDTLTRLYDQLASEDNYRYDFRFIHIVIYSFIHILYILTCPPNMYFLIDISNVASYELLIRTDQKLKYYFVDQVSKDFTLMSTERTQKQLEKLRSSLVLTG